MYRYHCQNPPVQTFHYHKLPVAFPDINENTIPQYFADMRLRYCFPPFCSSPVPISVDSSSHPSLFSLTRKGNLSAFRFQSSPIQDYLIKFVRIRLSSSGSFNLIFSPRFLQLMRNAIVPKGSHGLQSLQILPHVFRAGPVYYVPIL